VERWQEIASRQWGAIGRDQLRVAGLSDDAIWRLIKDGMLIETLPRVYRLAGAAENWHQGLMAPCLWGGPTAVASHRSAAVLWGFDGFREGPLEISSPKQKQFPGRFRLYRTEVDAALTTRKLGIPVTNAFRTVRDLVYVLDEVRGNQVVDEAVRKGFATLEALWRLVGRESCAGRRGVGRLRRLLEQRSPDYQPSASEFQAVVRRLLKGAGLAFVEEYVITASDGTFVARADFKLLDAPVIVEAEGRATHSSKLDWEQDLIRRNHITAAGLATVHVTWDMAKNRSDEFLDEVQRVRATSRARSGARR
jgi:very-short-patch-repair endonuclease